MSFSIVYIASTNPNTHFNLHIRPRIYYISFKTAQFGFLHWFYLQRPKSPHSGKPIAIYLFIRLVQTHTHTHTHTGLTAHTHAHTHRHTNTNRTEIHVKSKLGSTSNLLHIAGRIAPTFRHYYLYKTNFHHREVGRHLSRPTLHSPDLGRWCAAGSLFWQSLPPHSIALPEVEAAAAAEKSPNRFLFSMH